MNGKYQNLKKKINFYVQNITKTKHHLKKKTQQSTTDFLKMDFTPPKKDIVQMLTPQKRTYIISNNTI
jgi:hypothetical protein